MTSLEDVKGLQDLLARVTQANGADRDLDTDLCAVLFGATPEATADMHRHLSRGLVPLGGYPEPFHSERRNFTASLDATLALVERVLPGWDWIIQHTNGGLTIHAQLGPKREGADAFADTPALALIAAMLSALIAQSSPQT